MGQAWAERCGAGIVGYGTSITQVRFRSATVQRPAHDGRRPVTVITQEEIRRAGHRQRPANRVDRLPIQSEDSRRITITRGPNAAALGV